MLQAAQTESTFALNFLQNLGHCITINTFFPVVLQGVADSERRFIFIDIGAYGKQSDGGTFSASRLYHFLEDNEFTLPQPESFEGSGTVMPFIILGDEDYPLQTYFTKPFTRKDLSREERVFNYRLSRARRCIECAFDILTAQLPLLNKQKRTSIKLKEQ